MICSKLRVGDARVSANPLESRAADFQVGHADGILVGHPERQIAAGFAKQREISAAILRVAIANWFQPVQILEA